jgi:hypothetical protein
MIGTGQYCYIAQRLSSMNSSDQFKLPIPEAYWVIPGRLLAGEYPGMPMYPEHVYQRIDRFLQAGFDTFIDLTIPGETAPYEPALRKQAGSYGIDAQYMRFPTADFGRPSIDKMKEILSAIDYALAQGRIIYLHCYGGIGRTGTVIGCFLAQHGKTGENALEQLAVWWQTVPKHIHYPRSPETAAQRDLICNWREEQT